MEQVTEQPGWYKATREFTRGEELYFKRLESIFNMRTPQGEAIPYVMTDYQKEYHAESLNIKERKAKDILFIKARGVSFTFSSCIELIYSATIFDNQVFPIIAQRQDTARIILKICKWLIQNANADLGNIEFQESEIRFLDNSSIIKPFPSGSASDAVRSLRLIRVLVDEFAFQQRDKELLAAVQDTMQGDFGQILIGSTPAGMHNYFYELVKNPVGFKVFRLPVFDEKKFNPNISITKQDVTPIAPWIDLNKLEIKRRRDVNIFLQENMCNFLDDSIAFIPFSLVKRCEKSGLTNHDTTFYSKPNFIYQTTNPMVWGVDVARTTHLTAISGFEVMKDENDKDIFVQRLLKLVKATEIPKQVEIIDRILESFPSTMKVRIDMTGLGLGLYEYLKKKRGAMIEGIHFSGRIKTGEPRQKTKIREYMVVNLKNLMESGQVQLVENEIQQKHLTSMNYAFEVKEDETGHGDVLFADALALLPINYTTIVSDPIIIGGRPVSKAIEKDPTKWTIEERINYLKRKNRR